MAKAETKKVGGAKAEATKPEAATETPVAPKAPAKPVFDIATARNADGELLKLDENGRLNGVPQNWDPKVFQGLKRSQFGSQAVYLEYKAFVLSHSITRLTDARADLLVKAEEARKGVDPTTMKLRKLEKLQKMAAELEAQLKADGVEV